MYFSNVILYNTWSIKNVMDYKIITLICMASCENYIFRLLIYFYRCCLQEATSLILFKIFCGNLFIYFKNISLLKKEKESCINFTSKISITRFNCPDIRIIRIFEKSGFSSWNPDICALKESNKNVKTDFKSR